jgi:hypothetical protein
MRTYPSSSKPEPLFPQQPAPRRPTRRLISGLLALAAVVLIASLIAALLVSRMHSPSNAPAATGKPGSTAQTAQSVTVASTTGSAASATTIMVYFSKFLETSVDAVYPLQRFAPAGQAEAFSIQLLIAGPTAQEHSQGYFSELNSILSGPSSCSDPYPTGGPDFILTLNMKGTTQEQGTATLQFCRQTSSPGEDTDGRVKAEITATLAQFPTIKKVVILTQSGHCFADLSGSDFCLR